MAIKRLLLATFLVVQLCVLIGVGSLLGYLLDKHRMTPVLKIGEAVFVQEPEDQVKEKISSLFEYELILEDQTIPVHFKGSQKAVETWIEEQYLNNPSYDLISGVLAYLNPYKTVNPYPNTLLLYEDVVTELNKLKPHVDTEPTPASLSYVNNQLTVIPDIDGRSLDVQRTWQSLSSATQQTAAAVFEAIQAEPSTEELAEIKDLIGDYTTYFNSKEVGRTTNIRLSTEALNGLLIPPESVLSFNLTVGERAKEKGYLLADIYVDNRLARDYGGGVCQTASTLYQAARQGNLEIIERHHHTLPVDYVPPKGDATVAYGILDFKFKNNTSSYIYLKAETGDNFVRIRLYGKADSQHPVVKPASYPEHPDHPLHK